MNDKIKIGITMGDPSGIGPAIIAKALAKLKGLADFTVIGDRYVFEKAQSTMRNTQYSIRNTQYTEFINLNNVSPKDFKFGKVSPIYGKASIEYLDKALELIKEKQIDCIVTCPISKEAINLAGFKYSGHTEYFSQRAKVKDSVMMLLNNELKISLLTRHIPLKKVATSIDSDKIYKTIRLTYESLKRLFSLSAPRIVVCGLNPHASDNGVIGKEEAGLIKPALKKISGKIKFIDGPVSADIALLKLKQKKYDCAVAMYHDQALIPLKLTDYSSGVNITLGLPFIRTSPLHGTAFDIAGKDLRLANPDSLIAAVKLAVKCAKNQRKHRSR